MAEVKKGTCQFCGKEVALAGLKNHEKACKNKLEEAETPEEVEAVEVAVTPEEVKEETPVEEKVEEKVEEDLVAIRVSEDMSCYIGGVHYNFKKGTDYSVPMNVKEILLQASMLSAN